MIIINYTTFQKIEIKKSIFISYLTPISEFKTVLKTLKKEHPKASHIIWAYRKLNNLDQIEENSNDDGEPKGCAGTPTLNILRGNKIINSAILTIRYFGGIRLGTGGMVRAYGTVAKEVIRHSKFGEYTKKLPIVFETPYALGKRYEHYFDNNSINYKNREFKASSILWRLDLSIKEIEKFEKFKQDIG